MLSSQDEKTSLYSASSTNLRHSKDSSHSSSLINAFEFSSHWSMILALPINSDAISLHSIPRLESAMQIPTFDNVFSRLKTVVSAG